MKRTGFVAIQNYDVHLELNTVKLLVKKIKNNFNKQYEFRNKQCAVNVILFKNISEQGWKITERPTTLKFKIQDIVISNSDTIDI